MRRVAAGIAGLLSLAATALLAAVWYDDGTAAPRGPLLLGGIEGAPDQVPGLGWVRLAVVLVAAAGLAGATATRAHLRTPTPDTRPADGHHPAADPHTRPATGPDARPTATAAARPADPEAHPTAGPPTRPATGPDARPTATAAARPADPEAHPTAGTAVGTAAGEDRHPAGSRTAAAWAAATAALATVATGLAAWRLAAATPVVPRAAVVLAGAALAWALVALRPRVTLPGVVAVAAAVAVAAPVAGPWWAYDRLVHRSGTDAAPPAGGDTGPSRPGTLAARPADGAAVYGPYLVVRRQDPDRRSRIVVLDGGDGTERWSYRHDDAYVAIAGDPGSTTLVLAVDRDGAEELRAFDLASGRPLWNRREAAEVVGATRFDNSSVRLPGVLLLLDRRATRLRAYEPRTGAFRWERTLADPYCAASADYVRAGDVLVSIRLCSTGRTVPAYRLDTGADAWTATVADRPTRTGGDDRSPLVAAGVVGVWTDEGLVGVDAGTGRVRWRRAADPQVLPAVVTAGRFVLVEPGPGGSRQAVALDPRTGRPAWTTRLPAVPRRTLSAEDQQVAGTDGQRFYLLTGVFPGTADSTRLTVLGPDGALLGGAAFPGCPAACTDDQLLPPDDAQLAAAGGTLLVVPPRLGPDRKVAAITDGPGFRSG